MIEDEFLIKLNKIIKEINKNKKFGFDLNLKEFIKSMSLINPQSYGKRIENRIIKDLNGDAVLAKEDKGDMLKNGKYYEIKISLLTQTNSDLNLVQIRTWQNLDYYLCIAFDLRNIKNFNVIPFLLTKNDMIKEMKNVNATSAHGTKKAIEENKNIELRYSLKIDSNNQVFQRWKKKYYIEYSDLINNFN